MPLWIRDSAAWAVGQVPTLLTLAALGGLAVWGAANDWKLPSRAEGPAAPADEEAGSKVTTLPDSERPYPPAPGSPPGKVRRIQFASAETVEKAGIEVKPAR